MCTLGKLLGATRVDVVALNELVVGVTGVEVVALNELVVGVTGVDVVALTKLVVSVTRTDVIARTKHTLHSQGNPHAVKEAKVLWNSIILNIRIKITRV